ncbi:MerR family DNA-binding transcriptional regulator [Bacillus toyonensis]
MNDIFTISDIAKKTGLSTDTIRYYEKINLLPQLIEMGIIGNMFN